jgi:hypothetical protein
MAASGTGGIVLAPSALRDPGPFRKSAPWFALLMLLAVPAFWPSYLYVEKVERDWHVHLHGFALFAWGTMLVVQPWLISKGNWALHRRIGKLSYLLAPLVVASTILLGSYRLKAELGTSQLYFLWVQAALLALFTLAYVQAIRHRRAPALHARYMACTALAMLDPIMARIVYNHAGIDFPILQVLTWLMIDAILLYLWKRDAERGNGIRVFPGMLAAFVVMQVPTFFLYKTEAWAGFARWYAALPLP